MIGDLKSLGAICEFKYGRALPERNRQPGNVPVFGSNGNVGWHTSAITEGAAIVIGRKGSVGEVHYCGGSCWPIDTTYYIDNSATNQDLKWLTYALRSLNLDGLNKATGVPGLNRNDAYEQLLAVPPLEEQRRIAAILDQADDLRRRRRLALERLNALPQAIFQEMFGAVNGAAKANFAKLGDVCDVRDGTHDSPAYVDEGYPLATSKNLTSGFVDLSSARLISKQDFDTINRRSKVDKGDILMPMIGTIGSPVIVDCEPSFAIKNVALIKMKPQSPKLSYVLQVLKSDHFRDLVESKNRGGTQKFLSLGDIRSLGLPIPSKTDQDRFAELIAAVNDVIRRQSEYMSSCNDLFASLQHHAFDGMLTPGSAQENPEPLERVNPATPLGV